MTGPRQPRAALGKADLLRLLHSQALPPAQAVALCGFEPRPAESPAAVAGAPEPPPTGALQADEVPAPAAYPWPAQAQHFAAWEETSPGSPEPPAWLAAGPVWAELPQSDPGAARPQAAPMVPARRMAALLRSSLRRPAPSRQLDVRRWVALVTRGQAWQGRLPRRALPRWGAAAALVVDGGAASEPLRAELAALAQQALAASGGATPAYWLAEDGQLLQATSSGSPQGLCWRPVSTQALRGCAHWLWVSAGGEPPPQAWQRRLASAVAAGGSVLWLCAGAPRQPRRLLPATLEWVRWDQHASLRRQRPAQQVPRLPAAGVGRLVAAMSLAVRVEPALLRALRLALKLPAEAEVLAWAHADVRRHGVACDIAPGRVAAWRAKAAQDLPLPLRQQLARTVAQHHRHLSPFVQAEEAAVAADLCPGCANADAADTWQTAARTLRQQPGSAMAAELARYLLRLGARGHPGLWATPGLEQAWSLGVQVVAAHQQAEVPAGISLEALQSLVPLPSAEAPAQAWLVQRGQGLWLQPGQANLPIAAVPRDGAGLLVQVAGQTRWQPWPTEPVCLAEELLDGGCLLAVGRRRWRVVRVPRPRWAVEWGRDRHGLYASMPPFGPIQQERIWEIPTEPMDLANAPLPVSATGFSRSQVTLPEVGAFKVGVDKPFGAFAVLEVAGVTQRLRWLPPGEFWMGSTPAERQRIDEDVRSLYDDESPRHRVALSQGLWLADTACTQALWQAVMGTNPSHAKGGRLPVESVSHEDVQQFLQRLQALLPPGLQAALPTEAEWEYACRAGTDTAFSFGEHIGHDQANVDELAGFGLPAGHGPRGRLVDVATLPPNPWGFYEMHGNVWEWCADGPRPYAQGGATQVDPIGPQEPGPEAPRAVRGGSWLDHARFARSACRNAGRRGDRDDDLGFRLALRSMSTSQVPAPEEPVQPGPEARPRPRRDAGAAARSQRKGGAR